MNATAASMMGVEEGSSWHDYIMDNTVKQMTMVQRGLKQAQEEGYQFPASVQEPVILSWILSLLMASSSTRSL